MPIATEPASLGKDDVVTWAVEAKGYTDDKKPFATAAAQAAYDWMAARAGQLNPDQLEEQQRACAAYVRQMAEAHGASAVNGAIEHMVADAEWPASDAGSQLPAEVHPVGFGLILTWIIGSIIWNLVTLLFWKLVKDHENAKTWKSMHA